LIAAFPVSLGSVAVAASVLTTIKLAVILLSAAVVVVGGVAAVISRIRRTAAVRIARSA
jgi:hypothetical protein